MNEAFYTGLYNLTIELTKDRVPGQVINGLCLMLCQAAHRQPPRYHPINDEATQLAMEAQESLGMEAVLKGLHHKQWLDAICFHWHPPAARPDGSVPNHKLPTELCVSMIHQTWMLFEKMWSTRNEVLHSPSSALVQRLDQKYIDEFQAYKANQNEWFRATDRFMVDYSLHDFLSWPRKRRRSLLTTLKRLKDVYTNECKQALRCQPRIDQFFGIRESVNSTSSDGSYSDESAESSFTDLTSLASDLSGDTILSFGVLSDSEFPVGDFNDSSEHSYASRTESNNVG